MIRSTLLISLIFVSIAFGNYHYIREGGSGNGSNWDNALGDLPSELIRGDTYYLAYGSYSRLIVDDANIGSQYITIKKATESDHGTNDGWKSAYGDGQAEINGLLIKSSYLIFDGGEGGGPGSWTSGHGIKFSTTGAGKLVDMKGFGAEYRDDPPDYVQFLHCEFQHQGRDSGTVDDIIYAGFTKGELTGGPSHCTISYCYLHDVNRNHILTSRTEGWLVEYSFFTRNASEGGAGIHGEPWQDFGSSDVIIRYNIFEDGEGTAFIGMKKNNAAPLYENDNWNVYGNVFLHTATYNREGIAHGIYGVSDETYGACTNIHFYNNTVINTVGLRHGMWFRNNQSCLCKNNLFIDCWDDNSDNGGVNMGWAGIVTHQHNSYVNSLNTGSICDYVDWSLDTGEEDLQNQGNILNDWENYDFGLTSESTLLAGIDLGPPYNIDMFGNIRGTDGTWDRGAIEYDSTAPTETKYLFMVK